MYRSDEVFAVSRTVPLNYVIRATADDAFVDALARKKHIVLHGSSKQGKTVLRKVCLTDNDAITVQCLSTWDLADLQAQILKEAGFLVEQSTAKTVSGKSKVSVSLKAGFHLPLIGKLGAEGSGGHEKTKSEATTFAPLELDVEDVNDVVRALKSIGFAKYITLEDFHYLPEQTQQAFASVLKAYFELSEEICFVIVGVWLEHDRLAVYNGDLAGRLVSVNVDAWSSAELHEVIRKGEELLNIRFPDTFKDELVSNSFESVYIVQEACLTASQESGVFETQTELATLAPERNAKSYIKDIVEQSRARYLAFLRRYSDGFRETQIEIHRWIVYAVLSASARQLEQGLLYGEIRNYITAKHPDGLALNLGNLTIALEKVAALQAKKAVRPTILDYDQTSRRLSIVDRGFLVWLLNQDASDLKAELGLPTD